MKAIFWDLGVIAAAAMLVVGFVIKGWVLTIGALVLGLVLKYTNKHVALPGVYRELGIPNEAFEAGGCRDEKDNQ